MGARDEQLITFFQDFCDLFQLYGQTATSTIREKGPSAVNYQETHQQLLIKREIVRLLQSFVGSFKPKDLGNGTRVDIQEICNQFVPLLLKDFQDTPDCAKEPLELLFLATLIETLKVERGKADSRVESVQSPHSGHFIGRFSPVAAAHHERSAALHGLDVGVLQTHGEPRAIRVRVAVRVPRAGAEASDRQFDLGIQGLRSQNLRNRAGDRAAGAGSRAGQRQRVPPVVLPLVSAVSDRERAVGRERSA